MSITMKNGLIDQMDKFHKRIASTNISKYKKVAKNQLVVGFPIDEGVLGFQTKYEFAAVSPAYKIWKLKRTDINIKFIEILIRSLVMRKVYGKLMQGSVDRRRSINNDIFTKIKLPIPSNINQEKVLKCHKEIERQKIRIKKLEHKIQIDISKLWVQG